MLIICVKNHVIHFKDTIINMETINQPVPQRTLKDYVVVALKGVLMGASDVIPGVSGGTMAFILGIYEELINAIKSFDLNVIKLLLSFKIRDALEHVSWKFLAALFLGIMTAIFSLAKGLEWLLENKPIVLWPFFLGLILASVWMVSKRVTHWRAITVFMAVFSTLAAYVIVGMVPAQTPEAPWFIFLSGALVICAMILPGISGSFILVLLGKYQYILSAVNNRDVLTLGIFAVGAALGIVTFARILSWLFKHHHDPTIAMLTGLMLGSLRKVWPWKETVRTILDRHGQPIPVQQLNVLPAAFNSEVAFAIGLALLGFAIVFTLENLASRREREELST